MRRRSTLTEARPVAEATPVEGSPGRFRIGLITPGWGASGYYSAEVLEAAAKAKVFPAGTHMYLDHPTETENVERPERSVRDLTAVFAEDASWDGRRLLTEATVFGPWREALTEMKDSIGVSIRGSAEVEEGQAEGRAGVIIQELVHASSVDFVTHAGRGGRILEVLESARGEALTASVARAQLAEARNVGQWIESRLHLSLTQLADDMFGDGRLTREERIALSGAVGDGLTAFTSSLEQSQPQLYLRDLWTDPDADLSEAGALDSDRQERFRDAVRDVYNNDSAGAWVRDFDDTLVYFERYGDDDAGVYSQRYTDDGSTVTLTGTPTEVHVVTTYVPVSPAGSTATESQEDTMPQIEEARLRQLEEASGRVPTLETERDTAIRERDEAQRQRDAAGRELATSRAADAGRTRAAEALNTSQLPPAARTRVIESVVANPPLIADGEHAGQLDEAAFDRALESARTSEETYLASLAEANGTGTVRGFGGTTTKGDVTRDQADKAVAEAFGRKPQNQEA